jgi:predicted DNA binding CopG/RHH family protein
MKKSIKNKLYPGTFGLVKQVPDFLPPPAELNLKSKPTKISINLETDTLEYFKSEADKLGGSYQRMIRNLLNRYVEAMRTR